MQFDVITLFPDMFKAITEESIIGRAIKNKVIDFKTHNMRQWAWNSYKAVDDRPYGGGVGMLIRPDVIYKAIEQIKKEKSKIILTSARGKRLTQAKVEELAKEENLIIICGHYEGVDQRVSDYMVDEEISIGDYILTGGELAAMVIVDAVTRLMPGVLGKDESSKIESFSGPDRSIEFPQYTRPEEFMGKKVPEVLLSGNHQKIKEWQEKMMLKQGTGKNDDGK